MAPAHDIQQVVTRGGDLFSSLNPYTTTSNLKQVTSTTTTIQTTTILRTHGNKSTREPRTDSRNRKGDPTVKGNTTGPMGFPPLTPLAPPGSALLGGAGGTEEGKNERNKGEALAHFPISHMRPRNREELPRNIKPFIQVEHRE